MKHPELVTTKVDMIAAINNILKRFYGCETQVTRKVASFSKERWSIIYTTAWLWRNDPIAEQVKRIDEHVAFFVTF